MNKHSVNIFSNLVLFLNLKIKIKNSSTVTLLLSKNRENIYIQHLLLFVYHICHWVETFNNFLITKSICFTCQFNFTLKIKSIKVNNLKAVLSSYFVLVTHGLHLMLVQTFSLEILRFYPKFLSHHYIFLHC